MKTMLRQLILLLCLFAIMPSKAQNKKIDFEFLKWVLSDGRKNRDKYYEDLQMIREQMPDKKIYILKSPNEVKQFLSEIERNDL